MWSRDGRELFYRNGDQMWAVDIESSPDLRPGSPRLLFETPYATDIVGLGVPNYDVSPDGQHFLTDIAEALPAECGRLDNLQLDPMDLHRRVRRCDQQRDKQYQTQRKTPPNNQREWEHQGVLAKPDEIA